MVLLSLFEPRYQEKKVGLVFLPVILTKPVGGSDSHLKDLELNEFRNPKAQGRDVFITKHHHGSGDLDITTIHGHFSFYILVNQHSENRVILLVRVIDCDYQNQLYWFYAMDTRNIV